MSDSSESSSSSTSNSQKSSRGLLYGIAAIVVIGLAASLYVLKKPATSETATEQPAPTESPNAENTQAAANAGTPDLSVDENGLSKAVVTIETPKGKIKFRFYTKDAPATVDRIVALIQSGFYNGLTFHRVEPGFVIQGGDPEGNGTGGSGQKLKAEFNGRKHVEGTVAMARAQDPDSADSQFYIALGALPMLDAKYTVFGQVSEGMEVVKSIEIGDKMTTVTVQ